MELHKLPQSMVVPPQDNNVPPFGLKLDFAEGAFAGHCYAPSNLNALWSLIGASFSLESKGFFEIEREDCQLKFQGFGNKNKFCLFQDTYQHKINIFGNHQIDSENLDLLQVWDMRWELTYFLPEATFVSFEKMINFGNRVLQAGELSEHIVFSQSFPDLNLPDGYC